MRPGIRQLAFALLFGSGAVAGCQCDDDLSQLNGALVVEPPLLDFGQVPVGAEKRLMINLRNRGEFKLNITGFHADAPFVAPAVATASISTGRSRDFQVGFHVPAVGDFNGVLIISSDDPKVPTVEVPLTGVGIEAAVRVEPLLVDFGDVLWTPQTASMSKMVTVTNPGTDSFQLTDLTLAESAGGAFTLDPAMAKKTFAPGESQSFSVSFLPKALGAVVGRVSIKTTAPMASEIVVMLQGKAVGPVLEVCAGPTGGTELCTAAGEVPKINFLIGLGMNGTGRIRVLNVGDRNLTAAAQLLGMADEFAISPNPMTLGTFVLTPGTEQPFDVTYTPNDYAFDSVNFVIGGDSAVRPSATVRLDGRSPRPVINAIPRTANMTLAGASSHSEVYVTLTNCGELPVVLSAPVALANQTGPSQAFTLMNAPPSGTTIAVGPCQQGDPGVDFGVAFDATITGIYSARVQIRSNDPVDSTFEIVLNGEKRP